MNTINIYKKQFISFFFLLSFIFLVLPSVALGNNGQKSPGRYALIEQATGKVINVILVDPFSNWSPSAGQIIVRADKVSPGDVWSGKEFKSGTQKEDSASSAASKASGSDSTTASMLADDSSIESGDAVAVSWSGLGIRKSNIPYDNVIGVASGNSRLASQRKVTTTGKASLKVSLENGPIQRGDWLASSTTPGVAMKVAAEGQAIGIALEPYDGTQSDNKISTLILVGWHGGNGLTVKEENGKLVVTQGETLQAQIASVSARLQSLEATASGRLAQTNAVEDKFSALDIRLNLLSQKIEQQASMSAFLTEIQNGQVLGVSTSSASLINSLGDIEIQSATISGNLMVLGRTTVSDLGVTGNINAGLLTINGIDGEINTLSGNLYLQKNGIGGVDILNGKVVIDETGNMKVVGTITAGAVEANNYSVLGDQSIGSATISAGLTSVEIFTSVASESSKIFLTPTTLTDEQLFVVKKSDGKFKVAIPLSSATPITFDWWIVGNKN